MESARRITKGLTYRNISTEPCIRPLEPWYTHWGCKELFSYLFPICSQPPLENPFTPSPQPHLRPAYVVDYLSRKPTLFLA